MVCTSAHTTVSIMMEATHARVGTDTGWQSMEGHVMVSYHNECTVGVG